MTKRRKNEYSPFYKIWSGMHKMNPEKILMKKESKEWRNGGVEEERTDSLKNEKGRLHLVLREIPI